MSYFTGGFDLQQMLELSVLPQRLDMEKQKAQLELEGAKTLIDVQRAVLAGISTTDEDVKRLDAIINGKGLEATKAKAQKIKDRLDEADLDNIAKRHNIEV